MNLIKNLNLTHCPVYWGKSIEHASFSVKVLSVPSLDCFITKVQIPLEIEPEGIYEFDWTGPSINNPNLESPCVELPGLYSVEVTDSITECSVSIDIEISANYTFPEVEVDSILNCDSTAFLVASPINLFSNYLYSWNGNGLVSNPDSSTVLINSEGIYELLVEDPNTGCSIYEEIIIESLVCQINFLENSEIIYDIKAYPNPVTDLLMLEFDNSSFEVFLYNNYGSFITKLLNEKKIIDISYLSSGIYFLVFKKKNEMFWKRIIKI